MAIREREMRINKSLGTDGDLRIKARINFDWGEARTDPAVVETPIPNVPALSIPESKLPVRRQYEALECTSTCRYCRNPIAWGEVEEVTTSGTLLNKEERANLERTKGRWIPLDPDWLRHRCIRR